MAGSPRGERHVSRSGEPAAVAPFTRRLRDAFGRFLTGVVVLTTRKAAGGWAAVTVNSFASVSLDPPLVLWCLNESSNCRTHFAHSQRFAASVLRDDQQWISSNFARPSTSTWERVPAVRTAEGDLLIEDAVATFQCRRHACYPGGDHAILVGLVERFAAGSPARPLGFFRGSYGSFTPYQGEAAVERPLDPDGTVMSLGWG